MLIEHGTREDLFTGPLGAGAGPVVEGAAEHSVLARLQHHVTAHKPPDRAPAVSQQATQRQAARGAVGRSEHQQAQIQQVALRGVPSPEETQEDRSGCVSLYVPF